MYNFNIEEFNENAEKAKKCRTQCEKYAEYFHNRGYDNLVFIGVGATTAEFTTISQLIKYCSNVETQVVYAADVLAGNKYRISEKSIVITGSKSGNTKEVVECAKQLTSKNIEVFCITSNENAPLAKASKYCVPSESTGIENSYLQFYYFIFKLLNLRGDFDDYELFAYQLDKYLHPFLKDCREKFDNKAKEFARKYNKEEFQMWVASGELHSDAYLFTMCILEEMQWKKAQAVNSAEFFHGPLELYDDETLVTLVKGVGKYRELDNRVEDFLKKIDGKYEVIDIGEFKDPNIDEKFMVFISPMIFASLTTYRIAKYFEFYGGHSLDFRRYYRQFEY